MARLCGAPTRVTGAGRTDAGVHARGQAAGVVVPERWTPPELRRALNAILPPDVWVAVAHEMHPEFHPRFSATARRYSYLVGLDEDAGSPFRRSLEWHYRRPVCGDRLRAAAAALEGDHCFRAFAVRGTAPATDEHRCTIQLARWDDRPGGLTLTIQANRFLHHMVRFLVGTMLDIASGRREAGDLALLLAAPDNRGVSSPAPPHALYLDHVEYPDHLYLRRA